MSIVNENALHQLQALNHWLGDVFGTETKFSTLLTDAGLSKAEIEHIKQNHLSEFLLSVIELLESYMELTNDQRYKVMLWHYGLSDDKPQDYYAIGSLVGVCGERIRQLVNRRLDWHRDPQRQAQFKRDFAQIARLFLDNSK